MRVQLFDSTQPGSALRDLRGRPINYDPATAPLDGVPRGHWHVDSDETLIGHEPAGPPLDDGVFARACTLVREYEFTDPRIIQAVYRGDAALLGRDMLLEGHFFGLRFYLGVRVTDVLDETRGTAEQQERSWGWSYQTLQGHLEQGRLTYEIVKNLSSGEVFFRISGYSRAAPIPNPIIRIGFRVFGRATQRRFYRTAQERMRALLSGADGPASRAEVDGLVVAPSDARPHLLERLMRGMHHPGT